ncbi:iron(III) ABC transporter [Pseudomonas sp. HMWF032]|uniref:ChaN family lipoprotein n=1 Tax=Pseudomonas sp. HMWF032 TaxID=2056866 RepID=UPI000D35871F|nr:ChaN family lipoprotein [Pseudomonas sp. HMWF032]PTS83023.1 iron(III) ABC transporter [Pseudomonas sp. HMWF032]PTT82036.1 iron(III) ABC transporter [Pseudomonas sp. HMWF010]
MRIVLLLVAALLSACQALPALPVWQSPEGLQHPELGQIVELRTGARLTPEQLLTRLAAAPKVLVGERHDNPDHHALQLWLLRALAAQRPQGSLLLEMLTPDQQVKVDQVRAAIVAGQAPQDMLGALNWQPGWAWSLYGPLVQHALRQPYPLLSANLERREVMQIYARVPQLQGPASTAAPVREALFKQIRESHCNLLPDSQLPAMLAVQQQRDRRMAEALLAAPEPSLLFAGAFHVRRELGVPLHLQDLGAAAGVQVLILAEVGSQVAAQSADYVWYTPAQPEQDHCAKLRP